MTLENAQLVIKDTNNIFEELGFDAEEAASLKIRADLILEIKKYIQARGWSSQEAADFFDESKDNILYLINGKMSKFTIDKLVNLLVRAGMEVKFEVGLKRK
jgi:predicted XRE-type DNA-binding protein